MPYGDATTGPMAQYLRPMYLPAIAGIENAQTQGRWEQVQDEEKRKWEANRPFVDAQAKQMQFAANKAKAVGDIWNSLQGGKGSPELQAAGVSPSEFTRAYLGLHNQDPEIEADIPNIGRIKVPTSKYLEYLTRQKQAEPMTTVMFQGRPLQVPAKDAYHFERTPKEPPTPQMQYFKDPATGQIYGKYVTPTPGMRMDNVVPGGKEPSEGGKYTMGQMVDDNKSYYEFKGKKLMDPMTGMVKKEMESEYQQLLSEYQNDLKKISQGQKPAWFGGTSAEQDKDRKSLEEILAPLGLMLSPRQPNIQQQSGAGSQAASRNEILYSPRQFQVNPSIDTNRPAISNRDGSISTENTITIESDGKYYLIPTIVDGKQLTPDQAIMAAMTGKNAPVGEFNSKVEADVAARLRSSQIGNMRPSGR